MPKEKVLLIMPTWIGIHHHVFASLCKQYDVEGIYYDFKLKFKYKNIFQRLYNLIRKTIFQDKQHKQNIIKEYKESFVKNTLLKNKNNYDYCLVIAVEYFDEEVIALAKSKSKKIYAYQWDGLSRTPEIYPRIDLFDKFYAFNPEDVDNIKTHPATNFYFDENINVENKFDVFYIGMFAEDRLEQLHKLGLYFSQIGLSTNFLLQTHMGNIKKIQEVDTNKKINIIHDSYNYQKALALSCEAKMILDLKLSVHNGISFRIFEAMKYQKKIITTNPAVKVYDFYHPNNIFILDDNYGELLAFANSPYVILDAKITEKYSFDNWINYIFEKENAQAIKLPNNER
jgi:hypothetical protein